MATAMVKPAEPPGDLPTDTSEDRIDGASTAWRLLSSPGVFLGLAGVLALALAWAHGVPQRLPAAELAPLGRYAELEALTGLGFDDIWVSWVVLLALLLGALLGVGLLLDRERRERTVSGTFGYGFEGLSPEPPAVLRGRIGEALGGRKVTIREGAGLIVARRGFEPEAIGMLVLGVVALVASAFIGRSNAFEARVTLVPGQTDDPSSIAVRDGGLFLPRALPLDLRCQRPDPMDPLRRETCILLSGEDKKEELVVAPGQPTDASLGTLSLLREEPHGFEAGRPLDLVVNRNGQVERLSLQPGQATDLQATGDRLVAVVGPDGPFVLWTQNGRTPVLLAPPTSATRAAEPPFLEVVVPTEQTFTLARTPESILTILGIVLGAVALLVMGLVPNATLTLAADGGGTRVRVRTTNRPALARLAREKLLGGSR